MPLGDQTAYSAREALAGEMLGEEVLDAGPCVRGRDGVGSCAENPREDGAQERGTGRFVIEEGVPGRRVLLHIVWHTRPLQRRVQCGRRPSERGVIASEAAHDGTRPHKSLVEISRQHAVVDRRRLESARRRHQRETTAHAEADDAHPAGAVVAREKRSAGGLDVDVGPALTRQERPEGGGQAPPRSPVAEQVRHEHEESGRCEPHHLTAHHVVHPEGLVHHHHGRPRPDAARNPEHAEQGAAAP